MEMKFNKFVIIVPFRNVENYIGECIESVINQQYVNFEVYLLDDNSSDNTISLINEYNHPKLNIIKNKKRLGPTGNIYNALSKIEISDDDIILWLDGDDSLFGQYALQILNYYYNDNILLTYGQFIDSFGNVGFCSEYTIEEFKNIRKAPWKASHLKTFKMELFNRLKKLDPEGHTFRNDDGSFFEATSDMAFMIPLMELARYDQVRCIKNVIYCYRVSTHNDHSTALGRSKQIDIEMIIRNRKKITDLPLH